MNDKNAIIDIYLSAQSQFDHSIRLNSTLEPYGRIGFMAAEICLIMLEDTSLPTSDVCLSMANVFKKLSTETLKENSPDAEKLAKTFGQCEATTLRLAECITNRSSDNITASRHR